VIPRAAAISVSARQAAPVVNILLIDCRDHADLPVRSALSKIETTRYVLEYVKGHAAGVRMLRQRRHEICLVADRLDDKTGTACIAEAIGAGVTTPLILLTSGRDRRLEDAARKAGAADVVDCNPLDATLLEHVLRLSLAHARDLAALKESELRFRSVCESAAEGIVSMEVTGRVLFWNTSARAMFGYSNEVYDGDFLSLLGEASRETYRSGWAPVASATSRPRPGRPMRLRALRRDGTEFEIDLSLGSWKTEDSIFFSAVIRDASLSP
jgi:PAS domain S-box-containing protein